MGSHEDMREHDWQDGFPDSTCRNCGERYDGRLNRTPCVPSNQARLDFMYLARQWNPAPDTVIPRFTLAELEAMPTLITGHGDDLKLEETASCGTMYRVWLSRTGPEDGEPYPNKVEVEILEEGKWKLWESYQAK